MILGSDPQITVVEQVGEATLPSGGPASPTAGRRAGHPDAQDERDRGRPRDHRRGPAPAAADQVLLLTTFGRDDACWTGPLRSRRIPPRTGRIRDLLAAVKRVAAGRAGWMPGPRDLASLTPTVDLEPQIPRPIPVPTVAGRPRERECSACSPAAGRPGPRRPTLPVRATVRTTSRILSKLRVRDRAQRSPVAHQLGLARRWEHRGNTRGRTPRTWGPPRLRACRVPPGAAALHRSPGDDELQVSQLRGPLPSGAPSKFPYSPSDSP